MVSIKVSDASVVPTAYLLPFKDFAVTDNCEIADLSNGDTAAALAEIKAYGIRQLEFVPGTINLSKPTPNADGSIPAPSDPAYQLSTRITVYSPITVQ
jgi:hypothetical protein